VKNTFLAHDNDFKPLLRFDDISEDIFSLPLEVNTLHEASKIWQQLTFAVTPCTNYSTTPYTRHIAVSNRPASRHVKLNQPPFLNAAFRGRPWFSNHAWMTLNCTKIYKPGDVFATVSRFLVALKKAVVSDGAAKYGIVTVKFCICRLFQNKLCHTWLD